MPSASSNPLSSLIRNDKKEKIKEFVSSGGDVFSPHADLGLRSVFEYCVANNYVQCSLTCLESPKPMRIREVKSIHSSNRHGNNALHLLCEAPVQCITPVLSKLVERLGEQRPGDDVDWDGKNRAGYDFISHAAANEVLSIVWPIVKTLPFFADRRSPIVITSVVRSYDWDGVAEDQHLFQLENKVIHPSCELFLISNQLFPRLEDFQLCIIRGANILTHSPHGSCPVLHSLIYREMADFVRVCMTTERPIDFTVMGYGSNPFHLVCMASPRKAKTMLTAMVMRLSACREGDDVDWAQRDEQGRTFVDLARTSHLIGIF